MRSLMACIVLGERKGLQLGISAGCVWIKTCNDCSFCGTIAIWLKSARNKNTSLQVRVNCQPGR